MIPNQEYGSFCHTCNKKVNRNEDPSITITKHDSFRANIVLVFHPDCFYEISGDGYRSLLDHSPNVVDYSYQGDLEIKERFKKELIQTLKDIEYIDLPIKLEK